VSSSRDVLAPLAVESVMSIVDIKTDTNVDLKNIRISKKKGGTIDDTEIIPGLVFSNNRPRRKAGGPTRMSNAKIAVIQF
jgi:T-complex protein 1 subunit delta